MLHDYTTEELFIWYRRKGSNLHCTDFKSVASAGLGYVGKHVLNLVPPAGFEPAKPGFEGQVASNRHRGLVVPVRIELTLDGI